MKVTRAQLKRFYAFFLFFLFSLVLTPITSAVLRPAVYAVQAPPMIDVWSGYALLKRITSCESWGDPNKSPESSPKTALCCTATPIRLDPSITACVIASAYFTCYLPSRRAAAVEPVDALRSV